MSHSKPRLNCTEHLTLFIGLASAFGAQTLARATASKSPLSTPHHVQNAFGRRLVTALSTRQIQFILPPSVELYQTWCTEHSLPAQITEFSKSRIFWIGTPTPGEGRKLLFWMHGGGFAMPLGKGHCELMRGLVDANPQLSVAMLEYGLAPKMRYPGPFGQAVDALAGLLDMGWRHEDIIIGGDSAGGHMSLSILSHLLHPHPTGTIPPLPKGKFAGMILCSPCVTGETTAASMTECSYDIINAGHISAWVSAAVEDSVVAQEEPGYWHSALEAPANWWEGMGELVGPVLVTVGDAEVFRDDVVTFAEALRRVDGGVVVVLGKGETHEGPILESEAGRELGETGRAIGRWVGERCA